MRWYRTSLGKKYIMAVTGLIMVLYVIVHMLGNFSIFAGPEAINAYAANLRKLGPLLWLFRIALVAAAVLHVAFAVKLNLENRRARPVPYRARKDIRTNFGAETMIWNGALLGLFILYHLLHFTFRVTNPALSHFVDPAGRHDVFAMVAQSFRQPLISLTYTAAMAVLALHLYHGIQSLFQSLGLNSGNIQPMIEGGGKGLAIILAVGFAAIPAALMLRIMQL